MRPKVVAVDFDGVIGEFTHWKGLGQFGAILPGCREELQKLRDAGWYIIIFTTRGYDAKALMDYLAEQKVPWDSFNQNHPETPPNNSNRKVLADVYIDDRAINFGGSWKDMAVKVLNFKPHYLQHPLEQSNALDKEEYVQVSDKVALYSFKLHSCRDVSLYDAYMPHLAFLLGKDFWTETVILLAEDILYSLASCVPNRLRPQAAALFLEKNTQRGGLWRDVGLLGALIELHAKLARLKLDPNDEDSLIDLFNYCIIGLMCIDTNNFRVKPLSAQTCALVTGASGSLGRMLCSLLTINGVEVVEGPKAHSLAEIDEFIRNQLADRRPFHFFINNHGINHLNWIGNLDASDYEVIDVNLKMPLAWVDKLVNSALLVGEMEPRILNISSQTYRIAQRCTSAYCASKAGLTHLTKVMARELAPKGFVVNALAPGKIEDTRMAVLTDQQVNQLRGWNAGNANSYAQSLIPAGRYTTCEEVALAALKILHLPSYVNGAVIDMTGGQ